MDLRRTRLGCFMVALALSPLLYASDSENWKDDEMAGTLTYQRTHPDQANRALAVQAYEQEQYPQAYRYFLKAAYYGDKASQAAIAEMMWRGIGVEQNLPAAYAWMDAAAERGYKSFLAQRERYWAQLSEDQRTEALKIGAGIYAGYGDKVAKPRLERLLRMGDKWAYASVTHRAYARVLAKSANGNGFIEILSGYYEPKYWEPRDYWEWQKRVWDEPRTGTVTVGPLEITGEQPGSLESEAKPD